MEIKLPFYARLALVLLCLVLIIYLLYIGQGVLIPLFFAIQIALLLYPLACVMEQRWGIARWLASLLSVVLFVVVFAVFIYFLSYQVLLFSHDIPLLQKSVTNIMSYIQYWMTDNYGIDISQQMIYMQQAADNIVSHAAGTFSSLFVEVSNLIFWIVIIFIYTYFILNHRRLISNFIRGVFKREYENNVTHMLIETRAITNAYMMGLLIEFVFVAVGYCVGFLLLGIKYAVLLGLIAAVLNIIPYLGFIIASILVVLVTLMHSSWWLAVQAWGLLLVLHIIDANILFPKVVGNKVRMNPLTTIVGVLTGGAIWGVAGMFLSIPIGAMLKLIFENVESLEPWAILMGTDDDKKADK
jgi:AI-2 transport protein TqsA